MKKALFFFAFCLVAAVACNKAVETPEAPVQPRQITIHATIPQGPESKVALTPDGNGLHLAWEEGDCIRVTSETGDSQVFTIQPGFTDHEAKFTGTAVDGELFSILYPGTYASEEEAYDYPDIYQIQDGNDNTSHLKYVCLLSGVDSYTEFAFSSEWAEEHGGYYNRPGAVKLVMKFPSTATIIHEVNIKMNGETFSIGLRNVDVSESDQVLTAYAMLPWGDVLLPANDDIIVTALGADYSLYGTSFMPQSDVTLKAGRVSVFKTSDVFEYPFAGGSGEEGDPYLIGNERQLDNMHDYMMDGQIIYFKLINDISVPFAWKPLNPENPFNKGIDFDGDGHTISGLTPVATSGYPSFVGVLNGSVRNVIFDQAVVQAGSNTAGVLAGYIGSNSAGCSGNASGITVKNSTVTGSKQRLGGIAGYADVSSGNLTDCHVFSTTVTSTADRVGGLFGQVDNDFVTSDCTAEDVTVSGTINIGGLIGVAYGDVTNCTSSGSIYSINETTNADIGLGGLVGYFEGGTISKCSSSVSIDQTNNGRDIGGLVGKMLAANIEKSFATGDVSGKQRNVGGLVGLVTLASGLQASICDCYCTGEVTGNAYTGGFIGYLEKGEVSVKNCYSTSSVYGSFALGGMIGNTQSSALTMINSAAWNWSIEPDNYGATNWSSGAVCGVTFPTCTLTDNYRNPMMELTAYWVPDEDFDHPNVSSSTPLTDSTGAQMTDTGTGSGQPHYPQYPYHGKSAQGKTLSQLASALGWDEAVWNLGGSLPVLR